MLTDHLLEQGVQAAGVLDMFPHTAHFESLAVLSPGKRKGRAS